MWDHFALHQYLCGTTLYCTVYLTSTYVGPLCIASVPMWDHFVLHCLLHQYLFGPLCIATVCIYLISRPICMCDHFVLHCDCLPHQYLCGTTLYCISTYVGPLCIVLFTSSVPMWDHFALHQYLCGTTLYCTVYLTSTYVGPYCIVSVHMWDHFVLHCLLHQYLFGPLCIATVGICLISRPTYMWDHFDCLPHQYLCVTTLYCISTYVGPLCIALFTSSVPMWDHFALHQYIYGTTLYFTVYLISTYVGPYCIVSVPMWDHFVLHCLLHQYLFGPLCIATVCIYLISRPICMCDHFVLHCDCLPHQYLCGTTLYCISTYVGPLCIVLFTSSVPMWDHFALHQYLCGTTLYCTVYLTRPLCIALFTSPVPIWTTLYCNSRYMPHQ